MLIETVRVAAIQATPVVLDAEATVAKACERLGEAGVFGTEDDGRAARHDLGVVDDDARVGVRQFGARLPAAGAEVEQAEGVVEAEEEGGGPVGR